MAAKSKANSIYLFRQFGGRKCSKLTLCKARSSITRMHLLLAETPNAPADPWRFFWPAVGVVISVIVLAATFQWFRKHFKEPSSTSSTPGGFTLGDLRALVKDGKMSPEEFERAKTKILDAHKKATAVKPATETTSHKEFPPDA
jgi:hypothetical protein